MVGAAAERSPERFPEKLSESMRRLCGLILGLAAGAGLLTVPAAAETVTTVEMELYEMVISGEEDWMPFSLGRARLDVEAARNDHVKSQLSLLAQATAAPTAAETEEAAAAAAASGGGGGGGASVEDFLREDTSLEVSRAWTKVRFPWFVFTLGKASLSWGEGFALNAGDVFFPAWNPSASLGADTLRDNALWQGAVNWPLGRYSFLEAVYRAPGIDLSSSAGPAAGSSWEDLGAGGRFVSRLGDVKAEGGYAYDGSASTQRPYLSFQGHLLTNWHLSSSTVIPGQDGSWEDLQENWDISAGLYHLFSFAGGAGLNLRLEALVQPGAEWSEIDGGAWALMAAGEDFPYGVLLYPEAAWSLDQTKSLTFRSLVSPVDLSGLASVGFEWSPYQGLTCSCRAAVQGGEDTDVFALDRPGGVTFTLGTTYIY